MHYKKMVNEQDEEEEEEEKKEEKKKKNEEEEGGQQQGGEDFLPFRETSKGAFVRVWVQRTRLTGQSGAPPSM